MLPLFFTRCHAIAVSDYTKRFHDEIDRELKECGLNVKSSDIIDIIDDYIGMGYGKSTEEELGM